MSTKSKRKLFILGSTTALLSIATFGISATTDSNTALPPNITGQTDYFTNERNAAIEKVINQIGLSKDSFLDKTQNDSFKLINSWKQFDVLNSNLTIDQLVTRLQTIQNIGLYSLSNSSLRQINLQTDIDFLLNLKKQAKADFNNPEKIKEIYTKIATEQRLAIEKLIPTLPSSASEEETKKHQIKYKLKIDFDVISELWKRNPSEFRDFAGEYIKHWLSDTKNNDSVNKKSLSVTLSRLNKTNNTKLDYVAGSTSIHTTTSAWSEASDINGENSYRFLGNGTVTYNHPAQSEKTKNVAFVWENLSPPDFILFQLIASGQFQSDTETQKLIEKHSTNTSAAVGFNVAGITKQFETSTYINRENDATLFEKYFNNYWTEEAYASLASRNYSVTKLSTPEVSPSSTEPAASNPVETTGTAPSTGAAPSTVADSSAATSPATSAEPSTGVTPPVSAESSAAPASSSGADSSATSAPADATSTTSGTDATAATSPTTTSKNYDDIIVDTTYPSPNYYLAKARQPLNNIRQIIFEPFEQLARKYFIERLYAAADSEKLAANLLSADASTRNRLENQAKAESIYTNPYSVIKVTSFSDPEANSLSFRWFIATHYNKDGTPFTISRPTGTPEYATIREWKYNPNSTVVKPVFSIGEANKLFGKATDRMIYDYIEYVARINYFNLQDPISNEIFKNLYRLLRSIISYENALEQAISENANTSNDNFNLNGYNQNSKFAAHSEIINTTASMSVKYYGELLNSIQNSILDASSAYANNPSQTQLDSLSNIISFYQLYFNPLQFNVDNSRASHIAEPIHWRPLTTYISANFPNFGVVKLGNAYGTGDRINDLLNPDDTLTGRSVTYSRRPITTYHHTVLLSEWMRLTGTTTAQLNKEKFQEFKDWYINVKLRKDVKILTLRGSAPTASTPDIEKVNILGSEYKIDPRYIFGRLFAALEYTNNALPAKQRATLDEIPVADLKTLGLNTAAIYTSLGLASTFNIDNDLSDKNRNLFNKLYFDKKPYAEYLSAFKVRETKAKIVPLPPDASSKLYGENYAQYTTDYNNYLGEFYKEVARTNVKINLPIAFAPTIYTTKTTQTSNLYFSNYSNYVKYLSKYHALELSRRNLALKQISTVPLNSQNDLSYIVTTTDGTTIRNEADFKDASGNNKITTTNQIVKIQLGNRRVLVDQNCPYIIWKNPENKALGIERILPGANFISVDPENLTERITLRNTLIRQLERTSLQSYQRYFNDINTWFTSIRPDLNPADINRFSIELQALLRNKGTIAEVDGYNITKETANPPIEEDANYPWDNAATSSLTPTNNSYFKSLNDFVLKVEESRNKNINVLTKVRSLTLDLINKSRSEDATYSTALSTLESLLSGTKIVDGSGNLVNPTTAAQPLINTFPNIVSDAKEAIDTIKIFRSYNKGETSYTYNNYSNSLISVSDAEYRQAISTQSLIFEFSKYQKHLFSYVTGESAPKSITKAQWGFVNDLTFTEDELSSIEKYNNAVDTKTTANTAFKFFVKFFSPADSDSARFITDRNNVVNSIQDLYSTIGNAGSGAASYDPSINSAQAKIDALNTDLTGDIRNIIPNQRASLASKFFDATNALERIKIQTANLTALRSTKAALDFIYTNARVTVGKFNRDTLAIEAGYTPYFQFTTDTAKKINTLSNTINETNKAAALVKKALSDVTALNEFSSIKMDADGYLSALAAMTELTRYEQELVSSKNEYFSKNKWLELDKKLVSFSEKIDAGFTLIPRYQDTNVTAPQTFKGINNPALRNIVSQKILYLQYLAGSLFIKDNFIPSYDTNNSAIDPVNAKTEWDKFIKIVNQQGKSAVGYRSLNEERRNALNSILEIIFPVINRPNLGSDTALKTRSEIGTNLPSLQNVNNLRSILDSLAILYNTPTLLTNEYDAIVKVNESATTISAEVFESVIEQTKNFLDIHNGGNNSNPNFEGVADVSSDEIKTSVNGLTLNQFLSKDIDEQLQKLQNIKALNAIVLSIKAFREQYINIGIGGVSGRRPQDLKTNVSAELYAKWEAEDTKVQKLLSEGIIPELSLTFKTIKASVDKKVNLAPGLDASNNIIPVSLSGGELITMFSTIRSSLEKLQRDLIANTNALTNIVSSNQLVPLLNELNGNADNSTGTYVYNETANPANPNNIIYAVAPGNWISATINPPVPTTVETDLGSSSLKNFNTNFKAINAFSDKAGLNDYPYEDLLEIKTESGRGPTSLRKIETTQGDINTVITHLNNAMYVQVMNAIYWANTDFVFLEKIRELLLEETNLTTKYSDGSFIKTKKYNFTEAFNAAKKFFTDEFAKDNGRYVKVDKFNPATDLNGKIPLLNFDKKFAAYSEEWKTTFVKYLNSSDALQTAFRSKGLILDTLSKLNSATDTNGRSSYILAYREYLDSRSALNGTLSKVASTSSTDETLTSLLSSITSKIETDWETRTYTRTTDVLLQDILKKTKEILSQNTANKFIDNDEVATSLNSLKNTFAAKTEADTNTRVEVINRLPRIVKRISDTIKNTTMPISEKISTIKAQVSNLVDTIGIKKTSGTGDLSSDKSSFTISVYEDDDANITGILQTFKTLDVNLIKVARTYAKAIPAIELIVAFMEQIHETMGSPIQTNSNLFQVYIKALEVAFNSTSQYNSAKTDTPTLLTKTIVNDVETIASSTNDINTLKDLFASLEGSKIKLPEISTSVTTIVDGFVKTKEVLDNWTKDSGVTFKGIEVLKSRHNLIVNAKTQIDKMLSSNSANLITKPVFDNYKNQLVRYYKTLLKLEKTRNIFYGLLTTKESEKVNDDPNNNIEKSDLDLLYNEYSVFKAKLDTTTSSNKEPNILYHSLKNKLLDKTQRETLLAKATTWLLNFRTSIDIINAGENYNNLDSARLDELKNNYDKIATGFELLSNYYAYLSEDFVGNPSVNIGKVETNNVSFELDSSIRGFRKGSAQVDIALFTSLSTNIKELVAFNGIFNVNSTTPETKLGVVQRLLKNPTRENIEKAVESAKNITTKILPAFSAALKKVPDALSRIDDLTSWSIIRTLQDIQAETTLNIVKFRLLTQLNSYLFLNTDKEKTDLTTLLNSFLSTENINLLNSILDVSNEKEKLFADNYLQGLKSLTLKISKIGDQFNIIDKLKIGAINPDDATKKITAANIDELRTKYLNIVLTMVDGKDDASEITNLTSEITNETIRNFILNEVGLNNVKTAIVQKVSRKRFEVAISTLRGQSLEQYSAKGTLYNEVLAGINNADQSSYLKVFANLVIAEKDLEVAYNDYVLNKNKVTRANLFALEKNFLEIKKTFNDFEPMISTLAASEIILFNEIKISSNAVANESQVITSLQTYTEVPNNTNKADLDKKISMVSKESTSKELFTKYINTAHLITNKLNTYLNNEIDLTSANSSINNTVESVNTLLEELKVIESKNTNIINSPLFSTLKNTLSTISAGVKTEREINNLLEFNSSAKAGEPSFDTTTNSIKNKSRFAVGILDGDLSLVDSNPALIQADGKRQSIALRQILDIVNVIQASTDLISSGAPGFNYLGDPQNLSIAKLAYSGPNGIKNVYDRFVVNPTNWTNTVTNNSYARLAQLDAKVFEKLKALNQLSKVIYLFSAASNDVSGTDSELISGGVRFYDEFVKEYKILKANYEKYKTGMSSENKAIPNFYNENVDFWKAFERSISFIDTIHKPDNSGTIDLLNDFLSKTPNDAAKQNSVNDEILKVFNLSISNKIDNSSFSNLGRLLLNQLSQTSVLVKVTANVRSYYETIMDKGYRTFLGTYEGSNKARIDQNINNFINQFGTTDAKVFGSSWNSEVTIALQSNPKKVERLRGAVKSIQKFIDALLNLQIVVDNYVKTPTEENRLAAINATIWTPFTTAISEVEAISKISPDDTISSSLISFAKELSKLKEIQKNKIRFVQGILVGITSKKLSALDFASIPNPYKDQITLLGENFNIYDAIGVVKDVNNKITSVAKEGSILFGATRYRFSSDALVYQFLNLVNPSEDVIRLSFNNGKEIQNIDLDVPFTGKNTNYFQMIYDVKTALIDHKNVEFFKPENKEKLKEFVNTLQQLLTKIKTLNTNQTEVDLDPGATYNGVAIKLPTMEKEVSDLNIEKVLFDKANFLTKKLDYDQKINNFIVNSTAETFEQLQNSRSQLNETDVNVKEEISTEEINAIAKLNKNLDILNDVRVAFDVYKQVPSMNNLTLLVSLVTNFSNGTKKLAEIKNNLFVSKQVFVDKLIEKATSLNIQIELIKATNDYAINQITETKSLLEVQINKIKALPEASVEGTSEKILVNQIDKVKATFDTILPLKEAYNASTNFNGVLTDNLLKSANDSFNILDNENKEDSFIQSLITRGRAILSKIGVNRELDKNLVNYATELTESSITQLDKSIESAKELFEKIAKNQALIDQIDDEERTKSETLASDSIPSLITLEYIKAANEAQKTFDLFEKYKLNPSDDIKNQINRYVARIRLLNQRANRLSLEMEKLASLSVTIGTELEDMITAYNSQYPQDTEFTAKILSDFTKQIADLTTQKTKLNDDFTNAQNKINKLLGSEIVDQNDLTTAQKEFRNASYELNKFNNLTQVYTSGQKIIKPILDLRANSINLQISVIDALKIYAASQKTYSQKVYSAGQDLIAKSNQKFVINKTIESINKQILKLEEEIKNLNSISNPNENQTNLLAQKTDELSKLRTELATNTTKLNEVTAEETKLKTDLTTALNVVSDDTLLANVKTASNNLLALSKTIDSEKLKAGDKEASNETKLATQTLNIADMLSNLKVFLNNYFNSPLEFMSNNYDAFEKHLIAYETARKDVVKILPAAILNDVNDSIQVLELDTKAYLASSLYISTPNEENRTKSTEATKLNNNNADISLIIEGLANYHNAVNELKISPTAPKIIEAQNIFISLNKNLERLELDSLSSSENLTSLQLLMKSKAFRRSLEIIKAKFDILTAIDAYVFNPCEKNSELLKKANQDALKIQNLNSEEEKISVLKALVEQLKGLMKGSNVISNSEKNGLGDQVEKLLAKSKTDPESITPEEIATIKNKLLTGDQTPPLNSIKTRLNDIVNKLEIDKRTTKKVNDLKNSGSKTSDISMKYNEEPGKYLEDDTANVIKEKNTKLATIDKEINNIRPDVIDSITKYEKEVARINAIPEDTRTPKDISDLSDATKIIEATKDKKAVFEEKSNARDEKNKAFENAQKELNTLKEKGNNALSETEKNEVNTLGKNKDELKKNLINAKDATALNNREIKILEDKSNLILSPEEKTKLGDLDNERKTNLEPKLSETNKAIDASKTNLDKLVNDKAATALTPEQQKDLSAKKTAFNESEKAINDASKAIKDNNDAIKKSLFDKSQTVLNDRELRDYVNSKNNVDNIKRDILNIKNNLDSEATEKEILTSKPAADITNADRERIAEIDNNAKIFNDQLSDKNSELSKLNENIKSYEDKIKAAFSPEEKTAHDVLVGKNTELDNTLNELNEKHKTVKNDLDEAVKMVTDAFEGEDKKAYDTVKKEIEKLEEIKKQTQDKLNENLRENETLNNKVAISLTPAEKEKLNTLKENKVKLDAEVEKAQEKLNENSSRLNELQNKANAALSETERARVTELNNQIPDLVNQLNDATENKSIALNDLIIAEIEAAKKLAEDKLKVQRDIIASKKDEIISSKSDTSEEGINKTTKLNEELDKLNENLMNLINKVDEINSASRDINSLIDERERVKDATDAIVNRNNEELENINNAVSQGNPSPKLSDVVEFSARQSVKDSTNAAKTVGIPDEIAKQTEVLVDAVSARNDLNHSLKEFFDDPSSTNQDDLIKAIKKSNETNNNLSNIKAEELPTNMSDILDSMILENKKIRLETDIIEAGNNVFSETNSENINGLKSVVDRIKSEFESANKELNDANSLADDDATKSKKIEQAKERINDVKRSLDISKKIARYDEIINSLNESRNSVNTDPSEATKELDKVEKGLAIFSEDDADPVTKLFRDRAKKQIEDLREEINKVNINNDLNEAISNLDSNISLDTLKDFVSKLDKANKNNTKGAKDLEDAKEVMDAVKGGIDSYENSDVSNPETIAKATKDLNAAKDKIAKLLNNDNASQSAKDLAKSLSKQIDGLLDNLSKADNQQDEINKNLNSAITWFTANPSDENISKLKDAINDADNTRVNTSDIKSVVDLNEKIKKLEDASKDAKDNIFDQTKRNELSKILNEVKSDLENVKNKAVDNPSIKRISEILTLKANNAENDVKIITGNADSRAINKELDSKIALIDSVGDDKATISTFDTIKEKILGLPSSNEKEMSIKVNLGEKLERALNEVRARDLLDSFPVNPNDEQIKNLGTLVNDSLGTYMSILETLKLSSISKQDIQNFRNSSYNDAKISDKIDNLREFSEAILNNIKSLVGSKNATISTEAKKMLKNNETLKMVIDVETNLFEGVNGSNMKKINLSEEHFKDLASADSGFVNKEQYQKLFGSIQTWDQLVKSAKEGNIKSIMEINNTAKIARELGDVSNVTISSIISQGNSYSLYDSIKYKMIIAGIIAGSLSAVTSLLLLFFRRKRRK